MFKTTSEVLAFLASGNELCVRDVQDDEVLLEVLENANVRQYSRKIKSGAHVVHLAWGK